MISMQNECGDLNIGLNIIPSKQWISFKLFDGSKVKSLRIFTSLSMINLHRKLFLYIK